MRQRAYRSRSAPLCSAIPTRLEGLAFRCWSPRAWVQWGFHAFLHPHAGRRGVRRTISTRRRRSSRPIPRNATRRRPRQRGGRIGEGPGPMWALCARSSRRTEVRTLAATAIPDGRRPTCNGPSRPDFQDQFRTTTEPHDVPPARTAARQPAGRDDRAANRQSHPTR